MIRSPYRQCVDAFLFDHCPHVTGRGLDIGGGRQRGTWRRSALARIQWSVLDCDPGPLEAGVDCVPCRVEHGLDWSADTFAIITALDVLYMVPVPQIVRALVGIHRVLVPGGVLLATFPFTRPVSEDTDSARYTPAQLVGMLRYAGFHQVTVEPFGGWWSVLLTVLWDAAPRRGRSVLAILGRWARARDQRVQSRWTLGHGVVATKASGGRAHH